MRKRYLSSILVGAVMALVGCSGHAPTHFRPAGLAPIDRPSAEEQANNAPSAPKQERAVGLQQFVRTLDAPHISGAQAVYQTMSYQDCLELRGEKVCQKRVEQARRVSAWPPPTAFPVLKMIVTVYNPTSVRRQAEVQCWIEGGPHSIQSPVSLAPRSEQYLMLYLDRPTTKAPQANCMVVDPKTSRTPQAVVVNM